MDSVDSFWEATKIWIEAIQDRYEGRERGKLTQMFMHGPFAGMSEREIARLADHFADNWDKFPLQGSDVELDKDE